MTQDDKKLSRLTESAKQKGLAVISVKPPLMLTCREATKPSPPRQAQFLPCDAVFLQLKDQKDDPSVECQDGADTDASLTDEQRSLLGGDDLLLQIVADYFDGSNKVPKPTKIGITGITTPDCPISKHSHITLHRRSEDKHHDASAYFIEWIRQSPAPQQFLARSIDVDSGNYRFFKRYWIDDERVSSHRVVLYSCGIKAGRSAAVETLTGRIELYPDDKYTLSVEVPPFYKRKESYSSERDLAGTKTMERKSSVEKGREKTEEVASTTRSKDNKDNYTTDKFTYEERAQAMSHSVSQGRKNGEDDFVEYNSGETRAKNLLVGREEVIVDSTSGKHEIAEVYKLRPAIKFLHNDKELDVTKSVNNFIEVARNFQEIFEKIKELIPKVGFTWDFSLNVLAGTIEAEWGVRTKDGADHPRIWKVERYGSVSINVKILEVGFSAGFGIEYKVENWLSSEPVFEVVLKIELTLKVEWPFKTSFMIAERAETRMTTSPESKASLKGTARASLLGISTFCEAEARTGAEGKAELVFKFPAPPTLTVSGELKPLEIVVTHKKPRGRPKVIPVWKYPADGNCPKFKEEIF